MISTDERLSEAVRHFWRVRRRQARAQKTRGASDTGNRSAVTGGAHMDGFADLLTDLLVECGLPRNAVFSKSTRAPVELPGYFRPTKEWDLLVVHKGHLLVAIELKSHVGSFGNNYNNRTEEALGNATDIWTAYRENVFIPSPRPWLGYLTLLEDSERSVAPIARVAEPHFKILPDFRNASYARRYELLCKKLLRERLYDAACLLMSHADRGRRGEYREPSDEIGFRAFAAGLTGHVIGQLRSKA